MLGLLGLALLMLLLGTTALREALDPHQSLLRFVGYWFACAWLTVSALLLALFDILIVRAHARAAAKRHAEELSRAREQATKLP